MIKYILFLIFATTVTYAEVPSSYIQINPSFKLGKYENGNHFLDAQFMSFNYQATPYFSFSGNASVGFTAPRDNFSAMNHYINKLTFRTTYRPYSKIGYFAEASYSNMISGANNQVAYFGYGNYQAVGVEINWIEFEK